MYMLRVSRFLNYYQQLSQSVSAPAAAVCGRRPRQQHKTFSHIKRNVTLLPSPPLPHLCVV